MEMFFKTESGETRRVPFEPGETVMRIALANSIEGITGDCGGGCACATCHVYIDEAWIDRVGVPDPDSTEACMIEVAPADPKPTSRLGCQIVLSAALDGLVVEVPEGQ
ncbi:MAG TPA: 2Fe-2S iron-sulfur cluster-binding protein [Novosphingobium sp.]